ncbi:MAG: hypothetical protein HS116_05830 [Planctomycetes bacterium]|nr:hypothetical protein [Planctomycetota bacterium]
MAFQEQVIQDAAEWMSKATGATSLSLASALHALINDHKDDPSLASLLRIDCEIVKNSPSKAQCTVVVAVNDEGRTLIGKITREVPWEYLPDEVCSEFIRNGEKVQSFTIVERKEDLPTPQANPI